MEFRVLGPLEVRDDAGNVVPVPGARERRLLVVLLLEANEVVPLGRLIGALWAGKRPETAARLARRHLARLSGLLDAGAERGAPGRLVVSSGGYRLRVGRGELDLHRFEALVGEARARTDTAASLALRRMAQELWRSPPLEEFAHEGFARAEVARLEEIRLASIEERIDLELRLGHHAGVIGELRALTAAHPLREAPHGQLMLALHRAGREAEALLVYRDLAGLLARELGVEPGATLREIERSISLREAAAERALPRQDDAVPPASSEQRGKGGDVRKTVTILFTDIVDSSQLSVALDAEALRTLLTRYFGALSGIVERHGGIVEKYIGDAIMAVFGVPVLHEDDALRAVRAAVEMRDTLVSLNRELEAGWGVRLASRIGINTGEVIAGDHRPGQLLVTGRAVHGAKRLEEAAAANEILIGGPTHWLVRDAVLVEPSGPRILKQGETIHAHVVVDLLAAGPARRFDSPFVGRERQRSEIERAFGRAVGDRSCQLLTVIGNAGVGKSRLVREFTAGLSGEAMVVRGRCLPYGEGITYWPLAEIVREITRAEGLDPGEQYAATIAARLAGDEKAELVAERVAEAIGLASARRGTSEETFWAVRKLFEALARTRPLVVLLDDLHWAEPTFLDLIEHVADVSRGAPILLVGLGRPELLDARPGWRSGRQNATSIGLEPLSDAECRELVSNLLDRAPLPPGAGAKIARAAGGNALFAEEFVAMLVDDALITRRDGRWIAASDLSEMPVPSTIHALLSARLEGLPGDERAILRSAAVEGEVFHRRAIAELARPALDMGIEAGLLGLVRRDLIRPEGADFAGEEAYRFRHALIRDAAYRSLPKNARADLHERYAAWLELTAGERLGEFEEIVGYHLEQAFRYRVSLGSRDPHATALAARACRRLEAAGRRALVRSDLPAAVGLLERVSGLLLPDDPRRPGLLAEIGGALMECGRLSEAASVLDDAERLATTARDEHAESLVHVQQQFLRMLHVEDGGMEDAARAAEQAVRVFERSGDDLGLCRARKLEAWLHWNRARAEAAAESWERAAAHARRAGDRHEHDDILPWIASSLWFGPTPAEEGIRRCEAMREQVRESPESEAAILRHLAGLHAMVGRFDLARDLLATSNAAYMDLGLTLSAVTSHNEAAVELLAGNPAAAEASLRAGYRALEEMGERAYRSTTAGFLAWATLEQGRDRDAEDLATLTAELAASGDLLTQVLWRRVRARVLARRGQIEEAEALAREATTIAAATDFLNYRADAMLDLAEVLEASRRRREAIAAASEALHLYELKGNTVAASATRVRLGELARM